MEEVPIIGQKKKVFFVAGVFGGCYYYRCHLPIEYIKKYDCLGDADMIKRKKLQNPEIARRMIESDIIVFQRPADINRLKMGMMFQSRGKKVVFENDDTLNIDIDNPRYNVAGASDIETQKRVLKRYQDGLNAFLKLADLVITSTEYLAAEYRQKTEKVIVIPNCLDFALYQPRENRNKRVRLGLVGSVIYQENMEAFQKVIEELLKEDVELVVFGFQGKEVFKRNPIAEKIMTPHTDFFKKYRKKIRFVDSVHPFKYPATLAKCKIDIMLMPRKDNYFNRAKSNIKYLEASALKIPTVAQSFLDEKSPYEEITDGENGFLARTDEEWIEKTKRLIHDELLRKTIGENAYNYVQKYEIADNYKRWELAFDQLWK